MAAQDSTQGAPLEVNPKPSDPETERRNARTSNTHRAIKALGVTALDRIKKDLWPCIDPGDGKEAGDVDALASVEASVATMVDLVDALMAGDGTERIAFPE